MLYGKAYYLKIEFKILGNPLLNNLIKFLNN